MNIPRPMTKKLRIAMLINKYISLDASVVVLIRYLKINDMRNGIEKTANLKRFMPSVSNTTSSDISFPKLSAKSRKLLIVASNVNITTINANIVIYVILVHGLFKNNGRIINISAYA